MFKMILGLLHNDYISLHLYGNVVCLFLFPSVLNCLLSAKVQEETDCVTGRHWSLCTQKRGYIPYMNAVIHKIQRYIDLTPICLPHVVTHDINIRNYLIPKVRLVSLILTSVVKFSF